MKWLVLLLNQLTPINSMSSFVRQINIFEEKKTIDHFLDFVSLSQSSILGYHYSFYQNMLEQIGIGSPFCLGYFENNQLAAILPGFIKTSELGSVYNSLPFYGPNSGVLCEDSHLASAYSSLLRYLDENLPADTITAAIYSPFNSNGEYLSKWEAEIIIERFTSIIVLEDYNPSSNIRRNIRKSIKQGVTISNEITEEKINALFEIYEVNCSDYSIPIKPRESIDKLAQIALNSDNVSFYFAHLDENIIGGLIMIWGPKTASYYLPCSLNEYRSLQPNTLLINQAIEDAKLKKLTIWNWESSPSKDSGVYIFKNKWGGYDIPYQIHIKLFKPNSFYSEIKSESIKKHFPYYYVYPFNQLK